MNTPKKREPQPPCVVLDETGPQEMAERVLQRVDRFEKESPPSEADEEYGRLLAQREARDAAWERFWLDAMFEGAGVQA